MPRFLRRILALVLLAGCNNPFALGPASSANRVDTLVLYSVAGTALTQPSAYLLSTKSPIRLGIDPTQTFDFLYLLEPGKQPAFLPLAAVVPNSRTTGNPGFLLATQPFDSIAVAQQTGYLTTDTVRVAVGQVYYVRSLVSSSSCFLGLPLYGKLEVLSLDRVLRSVTFRILVDNNCGYRGLEVGLPQK